MDIEGSNSRRPIFRLVSARTRWLFLLLTSVSGRWWRTHRIPFANRVSPVSSLRGSPGTYTWSKQQTQALKNQMYPNVTWCKADGYISQWSCIHWHSKSGTEGSVCRYFSPAKRLQQKFLVISNGLALPVVQLQWLAQQNSNPAYQKCLVIGALSLSVPCSCRRSKLARRSCLLLRFLLEQSEIEWIFAWQSYLVQSTGHTWRSWNRKYNVIILTDRSHHCGHMLFSAFWADTNVQGALTLWKNLRWFFVSCFFWKHKALHWHVEWIFHTSVRIYPSVALFKFFVHHTTLIIVKTHALKTIHTRIYGYIYIYT